MDKIKICSICGFTTNNGKVMSNHKRWKHLMNKSSEEYQLYCEKLRRSAHKYVSIKYVDTFCKECGKLFKGQEKTNLKTGKISLKTQFCSKSCAAKQGSKFVDYSKISEWQKNHLTGCFSPEWKAAYPDAPSSKKCRSKREMEIVDFFKSTFPNDDWTFGCISKYENHLINPDLWSKKLKVVIEYDGVWHFKDIHHQLEKKQAVDRLVKKFCEENGYRLIRVDEALNLKNEQIAEAVYEKHESLELFGSKRYSYLLDT